MRTSLLACSLALPILLLTACSSGDADEAELFTTPFALSDQPPGSGLSDSVPVLHVADSVVLAIADRDWPALAALAHPQHGVRFSPYGHVDTTVTQRLTASQIAVLGSDATERRWGTADGTGDPLTFTFDEYYRRFLYDKNFTEGRRGDPGELIVTGNSLINMDDVFTWPGTSFVEYHVEGTEQYGGMDWGSLRIVLTREGGRWYVTGLVNDRWTV